MALNSYVLNWSDNLAKAPITVAPEMINTISSSLTLIGQGKLNYGESQQENMLRLLENFASSIAPQNPTVGQLWFDTGVSALKIYTGTAWEVLAQNSSITNHINDVTAAHAAGSISYSNGVLSATTVKTALDEIAAEYATSASLTGYATSTSLTNHINDITVAHAASSVSYSRAGSTVADVDAALDELDAKISASNVPVNGVFYENNQVVNSNYTVPAGKNAMSAGPISVATGVTVTVSNGSVWTVV